MNEVTKKILNGESVICSSDEELRATLVSLHEDGIKWRSGASLKDAISGKHFIGYYDTESNRRTYPYVKLTRKVNNHIFDGKDELDILSWIGLNNLDKLTEIDSDTRMRLFNRVINLTRPGFVTESLIRVIAEFFQNPIDINLEVIRRFEMCVVELIYRHSDYLSTYDRIELVMVENTFMHTIGYEPCLIYQKSWMGPTYYYFGLDTNGNRVKYPNSEKLYKFYKEELK